MSNANRTSKTVFIGLRLPIPLAEEAERRAVGTSRTAAIVAALEAQWLGEQILTITASASETAWASASDDKTPISAPPLAAETVRWSSLKPDKRARN